MPAQPFTSDDALQPLAVLAAAQPSSVPGHHLHPTTLLRWHKIGVRGVRLEAVRVGGRWFSSREAIERFLAKLNGDAGSGDEQGPATPAKKSKAHQRATAKLAAMGVQ